MEQSQKCHLEETVTTDIHIISYSAAIFWHINIFSKKLNENP